jgi:uncharacterized protein YukE
MTVLQVELSDLRGWADQVDRAGQTLTQLGDEASGTIADGDFGRILELVTGEYESMLPAFHAILPEDGDRLDRTAETLRAVARDLADTDGRVAESFGGRGRISNDHDASAFADVADDGLRCPMVPATELPHVAFGFPWDQACDILSSIGFPDPRDYVTQWIVGDIAKAQYQAAYWDLYGDVMDAVHTNLAHGHEAISRTWDGAAADRARTAMQAWLSALSSQGSGMKDLAGHVRDMVEQALDMAQLVVDTIKFFISTVAAGWSCAYIPIYGQIKLVDKLKDAWHLINDARKVISVFWSFLMVLKDVFSSAVDVFTAQDLPSAPRLPAA